MKKGLVLAIVLISIVFLLGILILNLTGRATENAPSGDEVILGNETEFIEPPSCSEGEARYYTCPDGKKVDWCHCSGNLWICVNSPENACVSGTCTSPVCGEAEPHFTGRYDEDNCPIYECEGMSCSPGLKSEYVCPDGTTVPDCECTANGEWHCSENPQQHCSGFVCPEGCVCNKNTIACSYSGGTGTNTTPTATSSGGGGAAAEAGFCPTGCLCTDNQIVCDKNLTSRGNCAMGCELGENCVLPSYRAIVNNSKQYCDANSEWKMQKTMDNACDNNFECGTNLCIDGKCITHNILEKFFNWFKNIFGGR
jgi:hypothetical protein